VWARVGDALFESACGCFLFLFFGAHLKWKVRFWGISMGSLKFNEMTNSIFLKKLSFTLEVKEMFPSWYIQNIRFFFYIYFFKI